VNFVLHAHLAHEDSGDPRCALGALLPDLWRMAARVGRARRGVAPRAPDAGLAAVCAGIDHHLEADLWFHKTPFFTEGERKTSAALAEVPPSTSPHLRLFAHATWEMSLDGALIRRLGAPAVEALLARAVGAARALEPLAADVHHGEARRAAGVDEGAFASRMTRLLDAVESFTLPGGYADAEGITTRLTGVRASFGFVPPSAAERATWVKALAPVERLADDVVGELLGAFTSRTSRSRSAP
jgi:hypothetical protein